VKVDPVSRPVIDTQLADAFSDGLYVSEVAQREAADANLDASPSLFVAELAQPIREEVGLADLDHALTIVHIAIFFKLTTDTCHAPFVQYARVSHP
jgi:hypothetical protein